ncbi:helix-turn-helix domain-containing protein [Enterococcus gallinarum]|uniref:Helix-turn-helix transcriptional regulator n=1 Tax=Enterococcus gallinarum TaxID=1353 RepID=A0ABD4HM02_ENTGA|nr:helix-turn-helix transcriptional regulator [Enterococcus gallinarum]MBA0948306.1 helix-turn-helix transcriptional regulator [Enterococcus gallinarum]MBA0961354.1 helix-turn-helix transcriptional regulator [Enterococcus gallinarum]MBA0969209.1 helix-turn-helix transcriptional regulator [Enterococcus gallinarum]MBA0972525.1 helix-turn-helix transcriptional regulator [Enterococcus gallinarum]NVI96359.1 helix-turn-helix transcriptional regulator [Enterococcus gallinarum]
MINLEETLIPSISERCKELRESYGLKMEQISDKAVISRIEKGTCPKSGNFITQTVLTDYVNIFNLSPEELIFGGTEELEETLQWIFDQLFFSILQKDLVTDANLYRNVDRVSVISQQAVLSMAEMFAEYNFQRYNFLKSDEAVMDTINKKMDAYLSVGGIFFNFERDFRSTPINEDTVIDFLDMEKKLWLMCKEKMIRSFETNVMSSLFENFVYSTINSTVNLWIIKNFCGDIVPTVVEKMKSNSIFKLGLLSKQLLQDFIIEDLPESYQKTVPIKTTRTAGTDIIIGRRTRKNNKKLSANELKEQARLCEIAMDMIANDEQPDTELLAEFEKYDILFEERPQEEYIREESINSVIGRATSSKYNGRTKNHRPILETGSPIFEVPNNISDKIIDDLFTRWYEDTHFNNQTIPGYFTNNSQIGNTLQEYLNNNIQIIIESIIHTQNNLLLFLKEEDLLAFAK